jgi:WD40 repeat protein
MWHPSEKDRVLTGSSDSTIRIWDLNGPRALEERLVCLQTFKLKNARGTRVGATSCCYDPDGDKVAGGAADGSVQVWASTKGANARPDVVLRSSSSTSEVTAVAFTSSGRLLGARSGDSVALWDLRKPSAPVRTCRGLDSLFETSNFAFSPDGKYLCAGSSVRKGQGTGMLKFFAVEGTVDDPAVPVLEVGLSPGSSVIQVLWHPRLNQVLCSTSAGPLKLLYDPLLSKNGALLTASRVPRRKDPSDLVNADESKAIDIIINPHALPSKG